LAAAAEELTVTEALMVLEAQVVVVVQFKWVGFQLLHLLRLEQAEVLIAGVEAVE
jgi:hypothetical protein